jgi:hypothetical protein
MLAIIQYFCILALVQLQLQVLTQAADVCLFVITGFHRSVLETFAPRNCYKSLTGTYLPTSWNNQSASSSRVKQSMVYSTCIESTLKMEPISCTETSVTTYQSRVRNIPEQRGSDVIVIRTVAECMEECTSGQGTFMSFRVIAT